MYDMSWEKVDMRKSFSMSIAEMRSIVDLQNAARAGNVEKCLRASFSNECCAAVGKIRRALARVSPEDAPIDLVPAEQPGE